MSSDLLLCAAIIQYIGLSVFLDYLRREKNFFQIGVPAFGISTKRISYTVNFIEASTKKQHKSKVWMQQRAGRITASNFKDVVMSNDARPPVSLIKKICYPEAFCVNTKATRWGTDNEAKVRNLYVSNSSHQGVEVEICGLFVSTESPFLAASPDGCIQCSCCEDKGVLEIKCPFKFRGCTIIEALADKTFCLRCVDNVVSLRVDHKYYYQVQAQLYVTKRQYCDFVVYTEAELCIVRILPDSTMILAAVVRAKHFFVNNVLMEIFAHKFTAIKASDSSSDLCSVVTNTSTHVDEVVDNPLFCYCRSPASDIMLTCQSSNCEIKKFHFSCLGYTCLPKRKWLCTECRKLNRAALK